METVPVTTTVMHKPVGRVAVLRPCDFDDDLNRTCMGQCPGCLCQLRPDFTSQVLKITRSGKFPTPPRKSEAPPACLWSAALFPIRCVLVLFTLSPRKLIINKLFLFKGSPRGDGLSRGSPDANHAIETRELGSSGPYAMVFCLDDLDKKSIRML